MRATGSVNIQITHPKIIANAIGRILTNAVFYIVSSEITFENAEELTEEGLPFLILFHDNKDTESIKKYKSVVETELLSEKRKFYSLLLIY